MRSLQAPRLTDIFAGGSMDQLPNLGREHDMLKEMGLNSMEDLFEDIPEEVRRTAPLPLPGPQSEESILADAQRLLPVSYTHLTLPTT